MVGRYRRTAGRGSLVPWLVAFVTGCTAAPVDEPPTDSASPTPATTVAVATFAATDAAPTVAATAAAVPAELLQVTGESEVELPDVRIVGPSPDGTSLATWSTTDGLCVVRLPELDVVACSSFEPENVVRHVDLRSISWAPDSSRIAFHEELFRLAEESDIWTMEVASGTTLDLTDDGVSGSVLDAGDDAVFDVAPAWLADGTRIAFGRTPSTRTGSELHVMPSDGSDGPTRLASVSEDAVVVYYGTRWSADGASLVYTLAQQDPTDPLGGIHVLSVAGGESRQVLGPDSEKGAPSLLGISPDASDALVAYEQALRTRGAAANGYYVLRMGDGALEAVREPMLADADPTFVLSAVLSPDGTKVAYAYRTGATYRLAVRDLAGGPEQLLVERSEPFGGVVVGVSGIAWPTDAVLYVPHSPFSGIVYRLEASAP